MKKIISVLMIVAMIASIAAVSASAAGQLYYIDTFEGDALNPNDWRVDGNLFYVEDGKCKGWSDAVANQSYWDEDFSGASRLFKHFSVQVDIEFYDFDRDGDDHWAGFWWRDYRPEFEGESPSAGIPGTIYKVDLHVDKRQVQINLEGEYLPEDHENPVAVYDLPEDYEIKVDASNPSVSQLGMRVTANEVSAYLDGKKVISYPVEVSLAQFSGSPIILFNGGNYIGFDNFVVASADYQLFADDMAAPEPPVDPQPPVEGDPIDPQPPVEGDPVDPQPPADNGGEANPPADNGGEANPPADNNQQNNNQQNNQQTNQGGSSNVQNGAQTGDAAIVVLAVMIVALGTAVAVKKVSVR